MKIITSLFFLLTISFFSCNREDEISIDSNGVAIKLPHLWKTTITDSQKEIAQIVVKTPVIYEDENILVGANKNLNRSILSLNSGDGKVNWEWNDVMNLLNNPSHKDPIVI